MPPETRCDGIPEAGEDLATGRWIYELIARLYPICRSITGEGLRQTLRLLQDDIPLEIIEVPSGTRVLDWTVPPEWNIRDAYVKNARGERVIDFRRSNLHVLNYSVPVRTVLPRAELDKHLFSLPEHPEWIPYRTSYYREAWGFCLSHRQRMSLPEGDYEAVIDATLAPGSLTYGELLIQGESDEEILISAHACHPSLANDNLSGIAVAAALARSLKADARRRYSYRFLFIPGTIGAITWLSLNEARLPRIKAGLVLSGLGDRGCVAYKRSRRGDAAVDRAAALVLREAGSAFRLLDFSPYGYDERQYCSPGFDLPVGRISRTPYGEYPEYHTSADDLDFVHADRLGDSFAKIKAILDVVENDRTYVNLSPKGEPQLGRRGLYRAPGPEAMGLLWVLNLSDGRHDLLEIAERSAIVFRAVREAASALLSAGLLAEISPAEREEDGDGS
jgi:aminopeptidase-like protein